MNHPGIFIVIFNLMILGLFTGCLCSPDDDDSGDDAAGDDTVNTADDSTGDDSAGDDSFGDDTTAADDSTDDTSSDDTSGDDTSDDDMSELGVILHYDGSSWSKMPGVPTGDYLSIWGTSSNNIYVAGYVGLTWYLGWGKLIHYNGSSWETPVSGQSAFFSVNGSSSTNVVTTATHFVMNFVLPYIETGALQWDGSEWQGIHYEYDNSFTGIQTSSPTEIIITSSSTGAYFSDGTTLTPMMLPSGYSYGFFGVSSIQTSDVFALGFKYDLSTTVGAILRYDGSNWTDMEAPAGNYFFFDAWGVSASDLFVVGTEIDDSSYPVQAVILYYNGSSWTLNTDSTTTALTGIWGSASDDVYAVGRGGKILHYEGSSWSDVPSGVAKDLIDVWGTSSDDLFVVGGKYPWMEP